MKNSYSRKGFFFFDRKMGLSLNFFLIWVFFKKIRKFKRFYNYRTFLKRRYRKLVISKRVHFVLNKIARRDLVWRRVNIKKC